MSECTFANPYTYGHECGKPASSVAVFYSNSTRNGLFFARRCAKCATIKDGENKGASRFEAYNPERHQNEWRD